MFPQGKFSILENFQKVKLFLKIYQFYFEVSLMVEKIRRLCSMQGKTISSLEKDCGFGSGTINKWDKSSPSVAKVVAVADELGVPLSSIIDDSEPEGSSPQFIRRTELLKRRGISFAELSKKTVISFYRLRHYFSEDTLGETDLLREYPKLARALGVSPQYLHCLTDTENDESDTDKRFRDWVVGNSNIGECFPGLRESDGQEKKPTPVSEDGLDEQDRQLMELMKLLTADQKEFLRAQLLTLTGRDK